MIIANSCKTNFTHIVFSVKHKECLIDEIFLTKPQRGWNPFAEDGEGDKLRLQREWNPFAENREGDKNLNCKEGGTLLLKL